MRKVIVIVAIAIAALAAFAFLRYNSGEQSRERLLRRLNENGVVVRRSCGSGEAYVDATRWRGLDPRDQERAAAAIASWCADQGDTTTLTFVDYQTRSAIARWNGTSLERTQ